MSLVNISKKTLFVLLATPNSLGVSRWVSTSEFIGDFAGLTLGNGFSWGRKESSLAKEYVIETQKIGHKILSVRLNGFADGTTGSQHIRADIKKLYKAQRCILLGTSNQEIDHKNGRKNDILAMSVSTQKPEDFQPLSKAANDAKRQHCKNCKATGNRFDAKLLGYSISFCSGDSKYVEGSNGCVGCFWYDPSEFRKKLNDIKSGFSR